MSTQEISPANLVHCIYFIRGHRVMLDYDLASLYGVETKMLKRAVRRNITRFPNDFMFELTKDEFENLRSQIGTSNNESGISQAHGGTRYLPFAFSEQGVAMLSGVLNSERAIQVNIAIMRTFVKIRHMIETNQELADKLNKLEAKYDTQFKAVFDALRLLLDPLRKPKDKEIGFRQDKNKQER